MYETRADAAENLLFIKLIGMLDDDEADRAGDAIQAAVAELNPGFNVINDISASQPTGPSVSEKFKRIQSFLFDRGAKRVIRVVGPGGGTTNLQLARTQREASAGYHTFTVATLAEAHAKLRDLDGR